MKDRGWFGKVLSCICKTFLFCTAVIEYSCNHDKAHGQNMAQILMCKNNAKAMKTPRAAIVGPHICAGFVSAHSFHVQ